VKEEGDMASPLKKSDETEEKVPDWSTIRGLRDSDIDEWVEEHNALTREITALETKLRELKNKGVTMLLKSKVKSVMVNGYTVTRIDGTSRKLDSEMLLKNGVSPKVIAQSYKESPWTSIGVRAVKAKEAEEN
jgi:hypothetical protein